MHTASPPHNLKHLLIKLLKKHLLFLPDLLRNLTHMRLQQTKTFLTFLVLIDRNMRLNLRKDERPLNNGDQLARLDVEFVLQ